MKRNTIILIVVLAALAAAVVAVVLIKNRNKQRAAQSGVDTLAQEATAQEPSDTLVQTDSMTGEVVAVALEPEPDYLVMVSGHKITEEYFDERAGKLMAEAQETVRKHPKGFLDQLVAEELLVAEAERRGMGSRDEKAADDLITALQRQVTSSVTVSDAEIEAYYNEHKAEMGGATLEQKKGGIGDFLKNQKKTKAMDDLISSLRASAQISWNKQWLARHTADDPLNRALATGRPVLADFGRSTCIPCKKMLPILTALKKEYAGRAEVLIIDIDEHMELTQSVGIRVIPTQIFYDAQGNEVYRHVGFMSKEDIVTQLKTMGVTGVN